MMKLMIPVFCGLCLCLIAVAEEKPAEDLVPVMFVQSAQGVEYKDGTLTLKDVSPTSVFFSDRPERIVGHEPTHDLIDGWSKGEDSFADDPPNATLSVFHDEDTVITAVVVLSKPRLEGKNLTYRVKILAGEIPPSDGATTLFIDQIGRPATPVSAAGHHRRVRRHEVRRVVR